MLYYKQLRLNGTVIKETTSYNQYLAITKNRSYPQLQTKN